MFNKLLLSLSIWIPFYTATKYNYYFIETANEQHLSGWYDHIMMDQVPITIRTQRSPVCVYRQYHYENVNYFLFAAETGINFRENQSSHYNYKWVLITMYPSNAMKMQHFGYSLEINHQIAEQEIQAMYVQLPMHWQEPKTNHQKSRAPWKHKFEYISAIIELLHQQEAALQSVNSINDETIKNLTHEYKRLGIEKHENLMAENQRLKENIKSLQHGGNNLIVSSMVVIGIILLIFVVAIVLWCCNEQQQLQEMHRYVHQNKPFESSHALSRRKLPNKQVNLINNEGNKIVARWEPEQFSDMLDNSQAIQDIMLGDIVNDMQTEGGDNADAKNNEKHRDSVVNDGGPTGFV